MMKGWLELQRSVYRAYSYAKGGSGAASSLTDRERDDLELIVEVKGGSSDQSVDLQAVIEKTAATMADKLDPTHITIIVISLGLMWAGSSVFKAWLSNRKDIKMAEIDAMKNKASIEAHMKALQTISDIVIADKNRAELIATAAAEIPVVASIEAEAAKGREALVRHVTKGDAVVNGVLVHGEAGQSITSRSRVASEDVRLDGIYKIRKVDTTVATGFRVHLLRQSGEEIVGDLAELMTTLDDREVIRSAEWQKVPVFLQVNAKSRHGEIKDAVIIRARDYDPETDGEWD
ncbi:hypothetical protein U703_04195 [Rhodobacter capsulatus YW1]|nr:hypothetical protein U703_04195 [Rhodobacter capsulatus YW1]